MRIGKKANLILSAGMMLLSAIGMIPVLLVIMVSFSSERSIARDGYRFFLDGSLPVSV
ncbi:MAG: hypothetical protein K6D90_09515 [Lachnospiraceae bacterium]|nr:hypothetical protein [Lachnospiraceae bacterium]